MSTPLDKPAWRRLARDRRAALDAGARRRRDEAIARNGCAAVAGLGARTVSIYLSLPSEPGTLALADALADAGVHVLAPVLTDGRGHGLGRVAWGPCAGGLRTGLWGIPEPDVAPLPAEELRRADLIVCSALQVDRAGYRVGTGGGWYDRALPHSRAGAPTWAVVDDAEIVDELPHDPWDLRIDAALTPGGLVGLGGQ